MSGAKKASARASWAMRGPSRQMTSRLVAGGSGRAASERARSAMTSPSAPSATLARVSGRLDTSCSGCAIRSPSIDMEVTQASEHHTVVVVRDLALAAHPSIDVVIGRIGQVLEFCQFGVGEIDDAAIGESTQDQIHLTGATMPRPVEQPSAAHVQSFARLCRSGHSGSKNANSPDEPGRSDIATASQDVSKHTCVVYR